MAFYTNHSRHCAIVTINVQSTSEPEKSMQKGTKDNFEDLKADVGYHDFLVEPGLELKLVNNTVASLVFIRADV